MSDVQKLVEVMRKVEDLPYTKQLLEKADGEVVWMTDTEHQKGSPEEFSSLIEEWEQLAETALITPEGKPHYAVFNRLKDHGYLVAPGETDSFGWLSGIVKKGCLRYAFF